MDKLLIGMDLMKEEKVLKEAYNDPAGVTEKFILNVVSRINSELNGNLEVSNFKLETELKYSNKTDVGKVKLFIKSIVDQRLFNLFMKY